MNAIGKVYVLNPRLEIGTLTYDFRTHHAMLSLDPVALLTVCRNGDGSILNAYCVPDVADAPYIQVDWQWCGKKKREKIGYAWSMDNEKGQAIYQIRIDPLVVLKRFDTLWLHGHEENRACVTKV